jgi:hypothetical protein
LTPGASGQLAQLIEITVTPPAAPLVLERDEEPVEVLI